MCKIIIGSYTGIIFSYTGIIFSYTGIIQLRRAKGAKIIQQLYTSYIIILCNNIIILQPRLIIIYQSSFAYCSFDPFSFPLLFLLPHLFLFLPTTFSHRVLSDCPYYSHWACPYGLFFLLPYFVLSHEHIIIFNFSFISLSLLYDKDLFI